jgi:hypothetical protein
LIRAVTVSFRVSVRHMTIRCPEDVPLCCYVTLYTWQHCKKLPVKHSDIDSCLSHMIYFQKYFEPNSFVAIRF